jgi:serine/threonine-protein kinase
VPPAGWLTIQSPLDLQVFEGTTLVGTTASERITLPSGPHTLRFVSTPLGFETSILVDVPVGRGLPTRVPTPNGTLSLNALPWANVSLDGQSLGTTPFANLSVPIGTHEVIWRHPQLGERRQTVVVTATAPVRLVMDLRR